MFVAVGLKVRLGQAREVELGGVVLVTGVGEEEGEIRDSTCAARKGGSMGRRTGCGGAWGR